MASLTPSPKMQFFDANGDPLVGGKVYTYAAGTVTPLATYTDSSGGTPNANPVILDSRGQAAIWLGTSLYKFVVHNAADVLQPDGGDNIGGQATMSDLAASSGSSLIGFLQAGTGATARTMQAKLRDLVSVKDFGATGDGATDDTTAIQNALNAAYNSGNAPARAVYFPDGTYRVTSELTCRVSILGEGPPFNATGVIFDWRGSTSKVFNFPSYVQGWEFRNFRIDMSNVTSDTTGMWFAQGCNSARFDGVEFKGRYVTTAGRLWYKSQTANFTVGQVVTGGTSGATATISADADSGTSGILTLTGKTGTFTAGETITDPLGGSAVATAFEGTYYNHDGINVVGGSGTGTKYDASLWDARSVYFSRCRRGLTFTDPDNLASGGESTFTQCFGNCKEYMFQTTGAGNVWVGGDFFVEDGGKVWSFAGVSGGGNSIINVGGAEVADNSNSGTAKHIDIAAGTSSLGQVVNVIGGAWYLSAPTYASNGTAQVLVNDAGVGSKVRRWVEISGKDGQATVEAKTLAPWVGVQFKASQNASTDPNCFDDYEEGTWTATVATGFTTTPTISMQYIKKAGEVTIYGDIQIGSSVTADATGITLTGVPFTAATYADAPAAPQRVNFTPTSKLVWRLSGATLSLVEIAAAATTYSGVTSSAAGNTPSLGQLSLTYRI